MSNTLKTRLLIAVFLILAGLIYLSDQIRQQRALPPPTPTLNVVLFPNIDQTQITRIELQATKTGHRLTLVRVPGDWTITDESGRTGSAPPAQIGRMIQILPTLRYNRVMDGSDVKAFGLADGGSYVVRFDANGRSYVLNVGDLNSAGSYSYVQRGIDSPVFQVDARQIATLITLILTPGS